MRCLSSPLIIVLSASSSFSSPLLCVCQSVFHIYMCSLLKLKWLAALSQICHLYMLSRYLLEREGWYVCMYVVTVDCTAHCLVSLPIIKHRQVCCVLGGRVVVVVVGRGMLRQTATRCLIVGDNRLPMLYWTGQCLFSPPGFAEHSMTYFSGTSLCAFTKQNVNLIQLFSGYVLQRKIYL